MGSLLIGMSNQIIGIVVTVLLFALFITLLIWIYRPSARRMYQKFGEIPLEEQPVAAVSLTREDHNGER